jgi:acyl carrier protein
VAAVLGHADSAEIPPTRGLLEMGFDSLTALELRNQINAATDLRLPATLVFDYPTVEAIADHIDAVLPSRDQVDAVPAASVLSDLDRLETPLGLSLKDGEASIAGDESLRAGIVARLQNLLTQVAVSPQQVATGPTRPDDIDSATDDEMFDLLGTEFGIT